MKKLVLPCVLCLTSLCLLSCREIQPPSTIDTPAGATRGGTLAPSLSGSADRLRQKIAAVLPNGWSIQQESSILTVTRDEKIKAANLVNAPASSQVEDEKRFLPDTFSVCLVLEPGLSRWDYRKKKEANQATADKIEKLRERLLGHPGVVNKFNQFVGFTDEGRAMVDEYKRLTASFIRLPQYFYGDCTVYFQDYPRFRTIKPDSVSSECRTVSENIRQLLQRY